MLSTCSRDLERAQRGRKRVKCSVFRGGGRGRGSQGYDDRQAILTMPDVELSLRLTQARQNVIPTDLTIV